MRSCITPVMRPFQLLPACTIPNLYSPIHPACMHSRGLLRAKLAWDKNQCGRNNSDAGGVRASLQKEGGVFPSESLKLGSIWRHLVSFLSVARVSLAYFLNGAKMNRVHDASCVNASSSAGPWFIDVAILSEAAENRIDRDSNTRTPVIYDSERKGLYSGFCTKGIASTL